MSLIDQRMNGLGQITVFIRHFRLNRNTTGPLRSYRPNGHVFDPWRSAPVLSWGLLRYRVTHTGGRRGIGSPTFAWTGFECLCGWGAGGRTCFYACEVIKRHNCSGRDDKRTLKIGKQIDWRRNCASFYFVTVNFIYTCMRRCPEPLSQNLSVWFKK